MESKINTRETITLLSLPKVGRKTARKLISSLQHRISGPADLFDFVSEAGRKNGLPNYSQSEIDRAFKEAETILEKSEQQNIRVLTFLDPEYPSQLLETPDFPVVLNFKGNIRLLTDMPTVAVIGTREPSSYGQKIGERVGQLFGSLQFNVVSGLAIGCDAAGHSGALQGHGKTTAVLAHGLDHIYPKENRLLAEDILSNDGVWVSEYFIGQRPIGNFFVERDRIQAGLSQSVFIVETDVKGGTMHTARFCREYKRKLVAFDHPPEHRNHPKAQGNRMLIQHGEATPIYSKEEMNTLALLLLDQFMEEKDGPAAKQTFLSTFGDIFYRNVFDHFESNGSFALSTKIPPVSLHSANFNYEIYSAVYQNIGRQIRDVDWFKMGPENTGPSKLNVSEFVKMYSNSSTEIFTDFLKEVYQDIFDIDLLLGLSPVNTPLRDEPEATRLESAPANGSTTENPPFTLEHQPPPEKKSQKSTTKRGDNSASTGEPQTGVDSDSNGQSSETALPPARKRSEKRQKTEAPAGDKPSKKEGKRRPSPSDAKPFRPGKKQLPANGDKKNPQQEIW